MRSEVTETEENKRPRNLPTPKGVTRPFAECYPDQNSGFLEESLKARKTVVWGGLSLLGEDGHFTVVVGILRMGWFLPHGYGYIIGGPPGMPQGLFRLNIFTMKKLVLVFPNYMVYIVGETSRWYTRWFASRKKLEDIAEWAVSHVHD